jgi:hypothetical protein
MAARHALLSMNLDESVKLVFGSASSGEPVMLVSVCEPRKRAMPGIGGPTPYRLPGAALRGPLLALKRAASFRPIGNLRHIHAVPRYLQSGEWHLPNIALPGALLGAHPEPAMENFAAQHLLAEVLPRLAHRIGGRIQPARFAPVHEINERAVGRQFPTKSRMPTLLRSGAIARLSITKVRGTPDTVTAARRIIQQ